MAVACGGSAISPWLRVRVARFAPLPQNRSHPASLCPLRWRSFWVPLDVKARASRSISSNSGRNRQSQVRCQSASSMRVCSNQNSHVTEALQTADCSSAGPEATPNASMRLLDKMCVVVPRDPWSSYWRPPADYSGPVQVCGCHFCPAWRVGLASGACSTGRTTDTTVHGAVLCLDSDWTLHPVGGNPQQNATISTNFYK